MTKHIIESKIKDVDKLSSEELTAIAKKFYAENHDGEAMIQRIHSNISDNKIYCIYDTPETSRVQNLQIMITNLLNQYKKLESILNRHH